MRSHGAGRFCRAPELEANEAGAEELTIQSLLILRAGMTALDSFQFELEIYNMIRCDVHALKTHIGSLTLGLLLTRSIRRASLRGARMKIR